MSFIDKIFGNSQPETGPKIDQRSKQRVDEDLAIAQFEGTDAERYDLGKRLGRSKEEVYAIRRAFILRTDLNASHTARQNESADLRYRNDDKLRSNPFKKAHGKSTRQT